MIDASALLRLAFGFLLVWGVIVVLHALLRSVSPAGDPLPPAAPHHGDDHS